MNRPLHHMIAAPLAAMLLIGAATHALAAAPTPMYSGTLSANSSCLLTVTASSKNAKVAAIDLIWYEAGYVNPSYPTLTDYVATSQWPASGPNAGVAKGKVVTFTFGPIPSDTVTHDWHGNLTFRDASGAFLTQIDTNVLTTNCFV
jgi:hypothetical protein